jgi:ABC-type polysaccharide/polyol phosphate transport system ATPase subunit
MKKQIAIQLTDISKKYEIHHEKPTLVEKFVKGHNETFWALRHIDLTVTRGEKVGIIGANGSGKTTLLKIIAGITAPSQGLVETHGKIVSLIDLEAGFHEDLSGEQNIHLNGMLLGMTKKEIDQKLSSIIRFADIKQFIDVPLYTYSQGMKLRLGFAVAIHANPDILILDEGLGAGDLDFQKKAQHAINALFKKNKTILFVTQQLHLLRGTCRRIILFDKGEKIADGGLSIIDKYKQTTESSS